MTTYAVTGATGGLGGAAVQALIARGAKPADIVAVVRDESKAGGLRDAGVSIRIADYESADALVAALDGVDRLLLVSSPEVGRRLPQHRNVVDAAKSAGVRLIAYTSLLAADSSPLMLAEEHTATEGYLAEAGIDHVLLRNGWYSENYAASAPAAIDGGVFHGAAGAAKVAPAARADFADAAAAALLNPTPGAVYELAGSEHMTYDDIAATFAEVSGEPVRYQSVSREDYAAALTAAGMPEAAVAVISDSDAGAAQGALDSASTDLQDLRGAKSTPFVDVIRAALA
ncbi:NAD(P)H-binding protein [Gordonia zhaorongruii]|uniref:NmrA family NAD(P)-binding protein n=1 Tax=Gordonia zhaorongruii TaxID=2597659 RepID=UPI001053636A|nr:NAD(P)H-binding protein [Gordonia zhaorongruii]